MSLPRETLLFAVNTVMAAVIIGGASTIARKNPILAGFITALPLSSLLALSMAYTQSGDGHATARYAVSIMLALLRAIPVLRPAQGQHLGLSGRRHRAAVPGLVPPPGRDGALLFLIAPVFGASSNRKVR